MDELGAMLDRIGTLVDNDKVVDSLKTACLKCRWAFKLVPSLLEEIIDDRAWMDRVSRERERFTYADEGDFRSFLTDPAPLGLGTTADEIRKYLGDSTAPIRAKFEGLIARSRGEAPANPVPVEHVGLLANNHMTVRSLHHSIEDGRLACDMFPSLIEGAIDGRAWLDRVTCNGQHHTYAGEEDFRRFIEDPVPQGLGASVDEVRKYLGDSSSPIRIKFEGLLKTRGSSNNSTGPY